MLGKHDWIFYISLACFAALQLLSLSGFYAYGWDESVYLHTSQNLRGQGGLLENLRPLAFPLMLLPFASILAARIFVLAIAILCLIVLYSISRKIVGDEYAWLAPLVLMLFPSFYSGATSVLAEIPAILFMLLSVYALLRKSWFLAGLAGTLAFFTRFQFGLYLPLLLVYILIDRKPARQHAAPFALGGFAGGLPMLLLNSVLYRSEAPSLLHAAFYPIINQLRDSIASPYVWFYDKGLLFYLQYLIKFSPLIILSLGALVMIVHRRRQLFLGLLASVPLLYLCLSVHKEARYLMLVISWLAILAAYGVSELKLPRPLAYGLLTLLLVTTAINTQAALRAEYRPPQEFYTGFLFALQNVSADTGILTATPMLQTNGRIVIGYYNEQYFLDRLNAGHYDYVYYTPTPFPCRDEDCTMTKAEILDYLTANYKQQTNYTLGISEYYIFKG